MLRRIWHLLYRHTWIEHDVVFNPAVGLIKTDSGAIQNEDERRQVYGFTDLTYFCHCGATKVRRLTGQHAPADQEAASLRKMAGLEETKR